MTNFIKKTTNIRIVNLFKNEKDKPHPKLFKIKRLPLKLWYIKFKVAYIDINLIK